MKDNYVPPWRQGILACWTICGMNHYHVKGKRMLFVSMTRFDKCITEEGEDDKYLWNRLIHKAEKTSESTMPTGDKNE